MRMKRTMSERLPLPVLAALAAAMAIAPGARAAGGGDGVVLRSEKPGFRTDLGLHGSFGGASCLGGGTNYASCSGTGQSWDTRIGFAAGVILRPYRHFSIGVDAGLMTLRSHQVTENQWWDTTVGPIGRFHLPVRIGKKFYFEPTLGLQTGFVYGVFREDETEGGSKVGYRHKHYGPFLSAVLGLDFFPVPRVGVGLEVRLLRTFYTNVCFETASDRICRGTDEKELVDSDLLENSGSTSDFLGDRGTASYPWKLLWGLHVLYYF
jgi:hypothetical protein